MENENKNYRIYGDIEQARRFIEKIENKKPVFCVIIGNTETGKIPGISAAGANPNITDYTPAADVEYLYYEKCKCIDGVPITPDGIPTPAIITRAALELSNIPLFVIVGGVNIIPQTPFFDIDGKPGKNIADKEDALENPKEVFERAKTLGKELAKSFDYLIIGESIAGGTTTALGILLGLGYNAENKVSSSLPNNPADLKIKIVKEGLIKKGLNGTEKIDIFNLLKKIGDPMQPAAAGLAIGAGNKIPIILAGGTQMAAVLALINSIDSNILKNIAIGTTRWIMEDKQSDLKGLIEEISKKTSVPIFATELDFTNMPFSGLQAYEKGIVKEGVGAGGISFSLLSNKKYSVSIKDLHDKILKKYEKLKKY